MPSARFAPPASRAPTRAARGGRAAPLRIRWDRLGRIALLVVLAVVAGLYVQQGLAYLAVRARAERQRALVRELARENRQLAQQERALNNPATIESDARALGMIRPSERAYALTGLPGQ